jgi:hypothetical protein
LPTAGFNMLRLLLKLDTTSRIDMYGFDFYQSGMLRLPAAQTVPHSPGHNSQAEKEWIMAHAIAVGDQVIIMQQTNRPQAVA